MEARRELRNLGARLVQVWVAAVLSTWMAMACAIAGAAPLDTPTGVAGTTGEFEAAIAYVKALPAGGAPSLASGVPSLAVDVTASGHWRIANAAGEVMTAAGADEVRRVVAILAPQPQDEATNSAAAWPALVMTAAAAARVAADLAPWPVQARMSLLSGRSALPLQRLSVGGQAKLVAEIRPHLMLEVGDPDAVAEALWQLARPIDPSAVRLLSLEPGGPRTLAKVPRREAGSRSPTPDTVDPYGLPKAMSALAGQKVLIVGRLDKELLWYQPRSGGERSVLIKDITQAAAAHDVALVVLDTRLPRQPGERTWAYLKVGVPGFAEAMQGRSIADFYDGLGSANDRLVLRVVERTGDRTRIEALPLRSAWGRVTDEGTVGSLLQGVVTGLTGKLSPMSVQMELRSRARQEELGRRWVPGISSTIQIGYALLLAVGLAAWPVARRWWARLWPPELRGEYRTTVGYWSAGGVRSVLFYAVFVPGAALLAFPVRVSNILWDTARLTARALTGGKRGSLPAGPLEAAKRVVGS